MKRLLTILFLSLIVIAGCQESKVTPTKGTTVTEVDQSVFPIVQKERNIFDSLYTRAKVELKAVPPLEGMVNLINNKSKMFVSPRYFNKQEIDFLKKENTDIKTFKFCYNAVAIIGSKKNPTEKIRVDEIKDALLGNSRNYSFIIPQTNTSTYQYIKEEILDNNNPKGVEVVTSDDDVLTRVEKNDSKLGIISFNIVQDSSRVKFIQVGQLKNNVSRQESKKGLDVNYYTPHPGFVLKNYYPLRQIVYVYLNEIEMSPASGFTTFLTSYEGQKIALEQNLAPAAVPVKINETQ